MKTKNVIACSLVAVAVACGLGLGWWSSSSGSTALAKEAVRQRLVDPESTKFRNVRHVEGELVCGEFNAKNRAGGYVGYRRFVYTGGDWATFEPTAEEVANEAQANALASTRGEQRSQTFTIAKEVFSTLGAGCL